MSTQYNQTCSDCYIEISAVVTEVPHWVEILYHMYDSWAVYIGYNAELLDEKPGEPCGIKSAVTLQINGPNAYDRLKTETGVHRLTVVGLVGVRTSSALVWVYPMVDDDFDIVVNENDLKVDTYNTSGFVGMMPTRARSAIRLTHIPTGIVATCQTDRSRHYNRITAMRMLKSRLYERELRKREAATRCAKTEIGGEHKIYSYVPPLYDHLDEFTAAALAQRVGATRTPIPNSDLL